MKLSDCYVRAVQPPPGSIAIEVPDDAATGLARIVGKRAKTWFVRFRLHGKRHWYALGRYPATSLAEARALAAAALPVPPVAVVQALLAWCEGQGAPGAQLALLALLAARADMVQALRWDEVNDDHLSWSADRMKGARDFDQPLSTAAKAWLDRVPKVHPVYVFPARHGRTEGQINLSKWTAKSPLAGYRTHDLRAAYATHAQEALEVSPAVIAATLDHSRSSLLGVTSRYLKPGPRLLRTERRAALQAWAALLTAPAADRAVDDAVPIAVAAK